MLLLIYFQSFIIKSSRNHQNNIQIRVACEQLRVKILFLLVVDQILEKDER